LAPLASPVPRIVRSDEAEDMKHRKTPPRQQQSRRPGREAEINPRPEAARPQVPGRGRLHGKVALVTGGDSGIGRAVAIAFAREGADVAIAYLEEHEDARETRRRLRRKAAAAPPWPAMWATIAGAGAWWS
jgi:hypothetical protein